MLSRGSQGVSEAYCCALSLSLSMVTNRTQNENIARPRARLRIIRWSLKSALGRERKRLTSAYPTARPSARNGGATGKKKWSKKKSRKYGKRAAIPLLQAPACLLVE